MREQLQAVDFAYVEDRVEFGRYRITGGERVIHGQRVLGVVRLVDAPAAGRGRRYVIERELTGVAELEAIVADDYVQQPPSRPEIPAWAVRRDRRARGSAAMPRPEHPGYHEPQLSVRDVAIAAPVGR
jgi:hypothetical protein